MDDVVWLALLGLLSVGPLVAVAFGVAWIASYARWKAWYEKGRRRG
jgi:hypothetical protein